LKAITIHQPWAQLLVTGEKLYETRSWHTSHRGQLVVHAARKFTEDMRLIVGMTHSTRASPAMASPGPISFPRARSWAW
jgi:hypothetical protein